MPSSFPRPIDDVTDKSLIIGSPIIEFDPILASGAFGGYRDLGEVEDAAVARAIEVSGFRSARSGSSLLVRELVRQLDSSLELTLFQHSPENMQLLFAASSLTAVSPATVSVADDPFTTLSDGQAFLDLANPLIVETITGVECDEIVDEDLGLSVAGADGDTLGDFALAFKPLAHTDVSEVIVTDPDGVTETSYTVIALGAAAAGNEVEVEDFVDDATNAGRLRFNVGGVATPLTLGSRVRATYRPTHAFVENTDYVVDYIAGRVRMLPAVLNPATEPNALELKQNQPMRADYDHTVFDHHEMPPYTALSGQLGRARIRLLTDVGRNIVWNVPSVQVRLTGDPFTFARDDIQRTPLVMQLLDNGGTQPYGLLELYPDLSV